MVFDLDICWRYPLEFYEGCLQYKNPWEIKVEQLGSRLGTEKEYYDIGYTHPVANINQGVKCSAYKLIPSMEEKLRGQMELAEKIRAVDASDVARLVIEKHFLKDIKGNLRKFSMQQVRCVQCNEKFRRVPLIGKCTKCGGRIIFTVSEGSIIKYLEPSISIANKYNVPVYLKQTLELTKRRIEGVFGKEKEKQEGLGKWFG
jgi:DNA polymerase II large subunit